MPFRVALTAGSWVTSNMGSRSDAVRDAAQAGSASSSSQTKGR